ncbi:MAG: hypothetical protein AB2A00_39515 [Myxococcota bacterium]
MDPATVTLVAAWNITFYDTDGTTPLQNQEMVDIAINSAGEMYGVSWDSTQGESGPHFLYVIAYPTDPSFGVAAARKIAELNYYYNGLTFAPAGMFGPEEVLVAVDSIAEYSQSFLDILDTADGSTTFVGGFGSSLKSSGDIVAVDGVGFFATVKDTNGTQFLAQIDPSTAAATTIGTGIGLPNVWGLAYWGGTFYGFNSDGVLMTIDATTGAGTSRIDYDPLILYGAANSPLAPTSP